MYFTKQNNRLRCIVCLYTIIFIFSYITYVNAGIFGAGNHSMHSLNELQSFVIHGTPAQKTLASSLLPTLPLEQLLQSAVHEHGEVRSETVTAIAKTGTSDLRALNMLLRLALADGYRNSRNRAIWALSVLVSRHPNLSPQVATALKKALDDKSNANLAWNAANSLSQLGDVEATKHIANVLSMTDDGAIGIEGINALSSHASTQEKFVMDTVYPYIMHPNVETASEALKVIAKIALKNVVAMKAVKASAKRHPYMQARELSKMLLQNIEVEKKMEEFKKQKEIQMEQERHKQKFNLKTE